MKVSAPVLGTLLAYSAAIEDKDVNKVKENILSGRFGAALEEHRKHGGYSTTDYVLCAVAECNYGEALQYGKRLKGWKPIWKTYPGRREGQSFVELPCLPPIPKGFEVFPSPAYKDLLSIKFSNGETWTLADEVPEEIIKNVLGNKTKKE